MQLAFFLSIRFIKSCWSDDSVFLLTLFHETCLAYFMLALPYFQIKQARVNKLDMFFSVKTKITLFILQLIIDHSKIECYIWCVNEKINWAIVVGQSITWIAVRFSLLIPTGNMQIFLRPELDYEDVIQSFNDSMIHFQRSLNQFNIMQHRKSL